MHWKQGKNRNRLEIKLKVDGTPNCKFLPFIIEDPFREDKIFLYLFIMKIVLTVGVDFKIKMP